MVADRNNNTSFLNNSITGDSTATDEPVMDFLFR